VDELRLDKWLWAARFFKTRQLAIEAVNAGRVEVNGARAKPARHLRPGDRVRVRRPPFQHDVEVLALSDRRGPAAAAELLYRETAASCAARTALAKELAQLPPPLFKGRPEKRERRQLERLRARAGDE
jgi:ribosome-associated heat shock protein Hsp15